MNFQGIREPDKVYLAIGFSKIAQRHLISSRTRGVRHKDKNKFGTFLLFLRNAQAMREMPRGKFQAMHSLPTKFSYYVYCL